jgi:hypothetical protein
MDLAPSSLTLGSWVLLTLCRLAMTLLPAPSVDFFLFVLEAADAFAGVMVVLPRPVLVDLFSALGSVLPNGRFGA